MTVEIESLGVFDGEAIESVEGLELNLSGVVLGIDPFDLAITLPGLGRLSILGD